jgi:NAD-dependent dihydropyrimidine dehydrogenase PreA subunit
MSIVHIEPDNCNGCGICVNTCWMDVLRMEDSVNKAVVRYPDDCVLCAICEIDCPEHAIRVSPPGLVSK